jgi:hypothetical protein
MQDIEEGHSYGKKKPRLQSRIQRHIDTATAIAGDIPYWIDAFLTRIERMFGDMALNLMINTNLDGSSIYSSQKKYLLKQVSVFT